MVKRQIGFSSTSPGLWSFDTARIVSSAVVGAGFSGPF